MLLNVHIQKDSATEISKEVTRAEAEALAAMFPVKVATVDGFVDWAEYAEKNPVDDGADDEDLHAPNEKAVVDSLLKRRTMTKKAFKALEPDARDKLIVEETALMASEAEAATTKAD
jgi:hypothetical protein